MINYTLEKSIVLVGFSSFDLSISPKHITPRNHSIWSISINVFPFGWARSQVYLVLHPIVSNAPQQISTTSSLQSERRHLGVHRDAALRLHAARGGGGAAGEDAHLDLLPIGHHLPRLFHHIPHPLLSLGEMREPIRQVYSYLYTPRFSLRISDCILWPWLKLQLNTIMKLSTLLRCNYCIYRSSNVIGCNAFLQYTLL